MSNLFDSESNCHQSNSHLFIFVYICLLSLIKALKVRYYFQVIYSYFFFFTTKHLKIKINLMNNFKVYYFPPTEFLIFDSRYFFLFFFSHFNLTQLGQSFNK